MIRFSCPRCLIVIEAAEKDAGAQRSCPRCAQRLEVPHHPQARTVPATPVPVSVPTAKSPSVTPVPALDKAKLNQLTRLQTMALPGTILAWIGFPILFGAPLLLTCLLLPFANINGKENTPGVNTGRIGPNEPSSKQADDGSSLGGCICLFVLVLWAGGSVSIVLARKKLNSDFVRKNTIRVNYSMEHNKKARYKELLRCLDDLASTKTFEIAPCERGVYEDNATASFRVELPRYLDCNYDVYCLAVGAEKHYLLPDCVLVNTGGEFFTVRYSRVSLAINNTSGLLRTTVTDYRWMHARVDGGPDRRYKHNYQIPVSRKVTVPLDRYGVMTFRVGRDGFIILTDSNHLLPRFDTAFHEWIRVQQ
jgi:hypothetical protein